MSDYGIDVSTFNSVADWSAVRSNGIGFASAKVTQGNYYTSQIAASQISGARKAGITAGGYHFADPRNGAVANADFFTAHAGPLGVLADGAFVPMLDVENSPVDGIQWDAGTANAFIPAWIGRLRQQTGVRRVAVYSSLSFWQTMLRPNDWADTDVVLWLALYNGQPGNTGGWTHPQLAIHQHTDQGLVAGVDGLVDRNVTVNNYGLANLIVGSAIKKGNAMTEVLHDITAGHERWATQDGEAVSGIPATTVTVWQNENPSGSIVVRKVSAAEFDDRVSKSPEKIAAQLSAQLSAQLTQLIAAVRAIPAGSTTVVTGSDFEDVLNRTASTTTVGSTGESTIYHVTPKP